MKGSIHKIHPIKTSRNGNSYQRIEFLLDDGEWAKTDICPDYANYQRWKSVVKAGEGSVVRDLVWKNKDKKQIDADSKFTLVVKKGGEHL
jgi:hypothetical protein